MAYLHGAKIMHRDLKCSNVLVDKDWNLKGMTKCFDKSIFIILICLIDNK
jgi:serine/threonine protein kinase